MGNISLLRRAKGDLWNVQLIMAQPLSDDIQLDMAAYHLQQAVEKLMKFELNEIGEKYKGSHDISVHIDHFDKAGLTPPKWIIDNATLLTDYATKARYGTNLIATTRKINELLPKAEDYYNAIYNEQQRRQNF